MPTISLYFVRHGQRIDQIEPSWTMTSPCPEDPPLTALGKLQARQTGKMIRDFAHESSSSSLLMSDAAMETNVIGVSYSKIQTIGNMESIVSGEQQLSDREHRTESSSKTMTFQKMTPPESPDFSHALPAGVSTTLTSIADGNVDLEAAQNVQQGSEKSKMGSTLHERKKKPHHFAIITSPFLRCSQTAIEMAIGMRNSASGVDSTQQPHQHDESDVVTIAVETGLSEWLSMDYVSTQPPESIVVQRIQEFAMSRRDHEQYYSIDWKYQAKDRSLPSWPETREDMQARLERVFEHVLQTYTQTSASGHSKYKDQDLSIVFVTHASPVNALLEACLETPILVPVPNCSISRCRWTLTNTINNSSAAPGLPSVLLQSTKTRTIANENGRWLLDYQTYTNHLDRDRR